MSGEQPVTVSDPQWAALALVCRRADGSQPTHVVRGRPDGDAAIERRTADVLARLGWIQITNEAAWPTPVGRDVLAKHRRVVGRRALRANPGEDPNVPT